MREIRLYGSEGGAARKGRLYPYPGGVHPDRDAMGRIPPFPPKAPNYREGSSRAASRRVHHPRNPTPAMIGNCISTGPRITPA